MAEIEPDDVALLSALRRQQVDALETLYDRYSVLMFSLACRMLGDRESAEEIVQEAFLKVWRAAASYDNRQATPRSWLLSIVRHACIDRLRARAARPRTWSADDGADPERLYPAAETDVWREVSGRLTGEEIRRALLTLPPEQRETIELAYFGGYTHIEIAERMAVPLGTVKGRMRMGLQKLRQLLAGREPDLLS